MSLNRWGLAPFLVAASLFVCGAAHGEQLEQRFTKPLATSYLQVGDSELDFETPSELDAVPLSDLAKVTDFHPETDRWTDRNNRIRVSLWAGVWAFSGEFDIQSTAVVGFRIAWEVPGFIGIRWDSGFIGWAELEVKSGFGQGRLDDDVDGFVMNHSVSLAIFNPELSVDGLAFWAGFGGSLWIFDFDDDVFTNTNAEFDESSIGGFIFIELDYEIADIFHIGIGIRQHFVLADFTDDGRFYSFNGVDQSPVGADGRNDGQFDDIAGVLELTINFSILF